jgi:hypothetical protein
MSIYLKSGNPPRISAMALASSAFFLCSEFDTVPLGIDSFGEGVGIGVSMRESGAAIIGVLNTDHGSDGERWSCV